MSHNDGGDKVVYLAITLLGYQLTSVQDAYLNYLLPSVGGCFMYIVHFSIDLVLVYRHLVDENALWASLTLFFMYLPVLGCFIYTISNVELWPEKMEICGLASVKWFFLKLAQHVFFPIWSMWRYAERIFWSIEAVRSDSTGSREEALEKSVEARCIEFYFFLKGFLHTIPQVLLQMHVLMRYTKSMEIQTIELQASSILINIAILANTTVLYQRFKTQKIGGKEYPWVKRNATCVDHTDSKSSNRQLKKIVYTTRDQLIAEDIDCSDNESDSSSTYYLEPNDKNSNAIDEVDFPNPLKLIKSLPEEDIMTKLLAFCWWYCFLVARFLAICTFAYFFPKDIIWLLSSHFILCVAFLLYDAHAYVVRRTKAVFFILMGLIYIFVIIEIKKQFKKTKFIYHGYFILVFGENFLMCMFWWFSSQLNDPYFEDWWFKYIFHVILGFSFLGLFSMVVHNVVKQRKVVVGTEKLPVSEVLY